MDNELAKRALDIFEQSLRLDRNERDEYVQRTCGDNEVLREEVSSLLRYEAGMDIDDDSVSTLQVSFPTHEAGSRYELAEEIGRGGRGAVFWAHDSVLKRKVAVKVLRDSGSSNDHVLQRFVTEARVAGQLQHPGIAPVYDLGRLEDGRPFLAMKLVRGKTLAEFLMNQNVVHDCHSELLTVFGQICDTVAYAHSRGIIHRDLKPENIMIGQFGEVQVMDWGLAKIVPNRTADKPRESETSGTSARYAITNTECESLELPANLKGSAPKVPAYDETINPAPEESSLPPRGTKFGQVMGTPGYMPPEQVVGRSGKASDVFALGAILYEMLAGRPFFRASGPVEVDRASLAERLNEATRTLEDCSTDKELVDLVRQCLEYDLERRLDDATKVSRLFSTYIQSVRARLHEAEMSVVREKAIANEERRRRRVTLLFSSLIVLVAIVGMGEWAWVSGERVKHAERIAALETRSREDADRHAYASSMLLAFGELSDGRFASIDHLLGQAPIHLRNWEWQYLNQRTHQHAQLLEDHSGRAGFAGFVKDTNLIIEVDDRSVAQFRDRSTGRIVAEQSAGRGVPCALCPNGVFVLSQFDVPVLWNTRTGQVVRRFEDHRRFRGVANGRSAISAGGTHVALAGDTLRLIEVSSGRTLKEFPLASSRGTLFSLDGKWLVWCNYDTVFFWDLVANREPRAPLTDPVSLNLGLALSPDCSMLATTSGSQVVLCDLRSNTQRRLQASYLVSTTAPRSPRPVFNADGSKLAAVTQNGSSSLHIVVSNSRQKRPASPTSAMVSNFSAFICNLELVNTGGSFRKSKSPGKH